jgi:hypothetical protein
MADSPSNPLATDDKASDKAKKPEAIKPLATDVEKDLRSQIGELKRELGLEQAKSKALEELLAEQDKARVDAKAKKGVGPTVPRALVQILGEGRRVIQKGGQLRQSELDGLTMGEHFEHAPLDE